MNPSRNKQTNIINDLDAIALAMRGGKRKTIPKKKNAASTSSPAPLAASSSKAKPAKSAKELSATQDDGPRFYEKNGVRIPLYEQGGKRRVNARLSSTLRNKNTEFLLDVVEQYAGADKRKEFKDASKSKAEMADWIEEHETYALGPNPNSKLNLVPSDPYEGLLASKKPPPNDAKGKRKGKAPAHSPESDQDLKQKRKRDNTPEPAQALEQTTKRSKIHHVAEQLVMQSPPVVQAKADIIVEDERRKSQTETSTAEPETPGALSALVNETLQGLEEEELRKKEEENRKKEEPIREVEEERRLHNDRLLGIMEGLGLHPDNPDASSRVVRLPGQGEDRVLTATTNPKTRPSTYVLHDTPILYDRDQRIAQPAPSDEISFLKDGKHGRGGNFDDDTDRRTGRGHQINPDDYENLEEYLSFRGQVLKKYPQYSADAGEEVHPDVKKVWDKNELWNCNFTKKYLGHAFSHLWPCGCERVRGESENDESEEE